MCPSTTPKSIATYHLNTRNRGTSMDSAQPSGNSLTDLTADVASAYLSNNTVRPEDIPTLIRTIHSALSGMGSSDSTPVKAEAPMPWKKAIKPDYIISFEDGKHYKSMKRHLTTRGMTPEQYREKWGLPRDFRTRRYAPGWPAPAPQFRRSPCPGKW